jgi:curli biogenesis system outer membrane secretion channel CsgG
MQPAPAVLEPSAEAEVAATSPSGPAAAAAAATTAEAAAPAEPKVSTRCNKCRKKVGLTGFKCKCGLLFCGQHRYAEAHDCGFDYKTTQREKLAAANPLVQAAKVERI